MEPAMWSELTWDLLEDIDVRLSYIDKVRLRVVCLSWNSGLAKLPNYGLPQLPWLLQTVVDDEGERLHGLFNIREQKLYEVDLPHIQRRFLKGSSHGWLVVLSLEEGMKSTSSDICLMNPLTGIQVDLPPRSTFPDVVNYDKDKTGEEYIIKDESPPGDDGDDYPGDDGDDYPLSECFALMNFINKIITSCNPSSENCIMVAIYGEYGRLAWCTPSQKEWTHLEMDEDLVDCGFEDIIFSHSTLYAVGSAGGLMEIDNVGPKPKVKQVVENDLSLAHTISFLVESSDGSVIMIDTSDRGDDMDAFKAYMLDRENKCWHLVEDIGDDIVFLGYNQTFSVPARRIPRYKGNCIYFTDNPVPSEYESLRDKDVEIGVYNLEDGSVERIPGFPNVHRSLWPQPVWVLPPTYN